MKPNKKVPFIYLICLALWGCGSVSQKEYDAIKVENDSLKREIEEIKYGADRLLAQANGFLESKEYQKAKEEILLLLEKHPDTKQASDAKQLLSTADAGIKEQEIAAQNALLEKEKVEKERLANATQKMRTKFDDVRGITWYYDKSTTKYNSENSFHLYIGRDQTGKTWLRFRISYTDEDWLFMESFIVKVDEASYSLYADRSEIERDNGYGDIWEWYDTNVTSQIYSIVNEVINGKSVKLRHNGSQYYKDRIITEKEKQALRNVLDAYEALGGKTDF
jgi:hypothetical protein